MISCFPITPPFSRKARLRAGRLAPALSRAPGRDGFSASRQILKPGRTSFIAVPHNGAKYRSSKQIRKSIIIQKKVKPRSVRFWRQILTSLWRAHSLLPLFILLLLPGCVRQDWEGQVNPASVDEKAIHNMEAKSRVLDFTSGSLREPDMQPGDSIYIDAYAAGGNRLALPEKLARLAARNFSIAESPSKASHILHISVLRLNSSNEASLEAATRSGFGNSASLEGGGGTGMLADALLVSRVLHTEKKEKTAFLKNVSARNARESAQMRIGLYINQPPSPASISILEEHLAELISKSLQ